MASPPMQRPGGRTQRNLEAVHQAVLDLLRSKGGDFTYADLAERSGVSRRTLHRRWPDRNELVAEALREDYGHFEVELTGDLAHDLLEFALRFRDFSARPTTILVDGLSALAPDAGMAHLSQASFEQATTGIRAFIERNSAHVPAGVDVDTALFLLMSPIVVSCSILRDPLTDEGVSDLVDHVLRIFQAPSAP